MNIRIALTVIMPPNPVLARLPNTATFLLLSSWNVAFISACPAASATAKLWTCTPMLTRLRPPVDEMCRNVRRCAGIVGRVLQGELNTQGSEAVALVVREELARRRLSRQWLADQA